MSKSQKSQKVSSKKNNDNMSLSQIEQNLEVPYLPKMPWLSCHNNNHLSNQNYQILFQNNESIPVKSGM